jgi:hypothetical protein
VCDDIRQSAQGTILEDAQEEFEQKMTDAEKLKDLAMWIPSGNKQMTKKQKQKIQEGVKSVMSDIAKNKNLDPHKISERNWRLEG